MSKTRIKNPFRPVCPSPAGLIVSVDENLKPNIMTVGELFNISLREPTIIGIAIRKATYTHKLISASMEFSANLPTAAILKEVDLIGTISGRNGLNKFTEYGLTPITSEMIAPPIIKECPVNMECKVLSITEVGDHDLFLGKVLALHVDSDKITANEKILVEKLDGFFFAEWEYYRFGEKLGDLAFSRKQ